MTPSFRLSDLPGIALVLDARLRVVWLNAAASAALGVDAGAELRTARPPFDGLAQRTEDGKVVTDPTRAVLLDPSSGGEFHAIATALGDGRTLLLVHDVSVAVDRHLGDLAGGFAHELRNVSFGLLVMADMLAGNPANEDALRHARASIARLVAATNTLQELATTLSAPGEEFDATTVVDAAGERACLSGSMRRFVRTGPSSCLAWGCPDLLARAVGVVLDDVATATPKADVIVAAVRSGERAGRAVVEIAVRALGDDVPLRDPGKIRWDDLVARRGGMLTVGLALARRWVRSQGGSLGARAASDGSVEMTIEVPARGELERAPGSGG